MLIHKVIQVTLGFGLAFIISWISWRWQALTKKGMWAATVVGGAIFGSGEIAWSVLMITFFVSSSVLSILNAKFNPHDPHRIEKTFRRDWGQVLANGGLGASLAMVTLLKPDWDWTGIAYAGALAATTADTWATELGSLSRFKPRLITTLKTVEPGTSGGVTLVGTSSTLAGSACIAFISTHILPNTAHGNFLIHLIIAGLLGSLFDSLLGATLQAMYKCPGCEKVTEQHPVHSCQIPTKHYRGWKWLNNDGVNFLSSLLGSGVSLVLWVLF